MTAATDPRDELAGLYRRHAGWLRRHLTRTGITAEDAEDAVQEAFAIALTSLDALRDPAAARSYLATTARRSAWRSAAQRGETTVDPESLAVLAGADLAGGADRRADAADLLVHLAGTAGHAIAVLVVELAAGNTAQGLRVSSAAVRRARARAAAALTGTEWARRRSLNIGVVPSRTTPQVRAQIERLPFRPREVLTRHVYAGMTPAQIAWHLNVSANSVRVSLHSARTALVRHLGIDREDLAELLHSCLAAVISACPAPPGEGGRTHPHRPQENPRTA